MKRHSPSRFVYFVQAGGARGPVKIGVTNNVAKRMELLSTGCPESMRCLAKFDYGDELQARRAEAMFHSIFEGERRARSEWFTWTDDIATLLDGLQKIARTFGPTGSRLDVSFDIVRRAAGGIVFRPRSGT